jgi:hypothetical protein
MKPCRTCGTQGIRENQKKLANLGIGAPNEGVAGDKVRNNPLGPRLRPLAIIEGHHQFPEVALGAWLEAFQLATFTKILFFLKAKNNQLAANMHQILTEEASSKSSSLLSLLFITERVTSVKFTSSPPADGVGLLREGSPAAVAAPRDVARLFWLPSLAISQLPPQTPKLFQA